MPNPIPQGQPPGRSTKYEYSYSGADADSFAWFPRNPDQLVHFDSMHTISVSVHEAKGQARALGRRGIKGLARGVRTIAGSIIMTVVNDHPLRGLMYAYADTYGTRDPLGWSLDRDLVGTGSFFNNYEYVNRLAVLLRPFNLAVQYVSEMGPPFDAATGQRAAGAGWMLEGVEFIDEGQVTSVNDIVTELTFSFIACDFKPFSAYDTRDPYTHVGGQPLSEKESELYRSLFEDWEATGPLGDISTPGRDPTSFDPLTVSQFNTLGDDQ